MDLLLERIERNIKKDGFMVIERRANRDPETCFRIHTSKAGKDPDSPEMHPSGNGGQADSAVQAARTHLLRYKMLTDRKTS